MRDAKFKVGQKVKVVEGGWGIAPEDVGAVVTVTAKSRADDNVLYKVVGDLFNTDDLKTKCKTGESGCWVYEESFEAFEEDVIEPASENSREDVASIISFNVERSGNELVNVSVTGNLSMYQVRTIMEVAYGPKERVKFDLSMLLDSTKK